MYISIINKSRVFLNRTSDLVSMTQAIQYQLSNHAAYIWNKSSPIITYSIDESHMPFGTFPMYIFDNSDQSDALGYHDETPNGLVYGKVFAQTILDNHGTILTGSNSVSACLSHEILELWADPNINYWGQKFSTGILYALELCDAVENDSYKITVGTKKISVSNFILPGWFDNFPPKNTKFDYLHLLSAPFTMTPGGYVIYMEGGQIHEQFGEKYPEWKKELKVHAVARTNRRNKLFLVKTFNENDNK